jgi:hypothetical protein
MFSTQACKKDYQDVSVSDIQVRYEQYQSGSFNMIWLPASKSLSDKGYIKGFQKMLHSGEMKSNDALPLNESIFAVEGLLNFEKCDATQTRVLYEDAFELTMDIESIDENGEVWIAESELVHIYNQIIPNTEVGTDEKISTIDLDVVEITTTDVQVRVVKTVSNQLQSLPPPPFDPNAIYDALGADVIAMSYQSNNNCPIQTNAYTGEEYMIPCHVGYPSQPYPSWVLINDALINYYNLLEYTWMVGGSQWLPGEKVWYTNIQNPLDAGTRIYYFSQDDEYNCALGRRDKIYMGGNFNSDLPQNLFWGASTGCGCIDAPEPVVLAAQCGSHLLVQHNAADDEVTGAQMNGYYQTVLDHVEERLGYFEAQGLENGAVATMAYFGTQHIKQNTTFGIGNPGVSRAHYCDYRIGTKN